MSRTYMVAVPGNGNSSFFTSLDQCRTLLDHDFFPIDGDLDLGGGSGGGSE